MNLKEKLITSGAQLLGVLAQEQAHHNPEKTVFPGMPELTRSAAAEGAVLLENRVLPLKKGTKVSLFGRVQCNWFCTGYGSGGDVNVPYKVSLLEGLRSCDRLKVNEGLAQEYEKWCLENPIQDSVWGMWPRYYPEMPLTPQMVLGARRVSDQAIVVIGRSSGEDRENVLEPGSFYLTEEEKTMLKMVTRAFPDAVLLLNIGAVMDLSFLEDYSFGAVMILWQGGMESGNAAADLLCGKATPSGRLTDTVARKYEDYPSAAHFGRKDSNEYFEDIYVGYRYFETFAPEKVLYPFGYGLSYTNFDGNVEVEESNLVYHITLTNAGALPGKQTVMLFVEKPCGALGNPARELVAFGKTGELYPGESEELTLSVTEEQLASYCDSYLNGPKNCWLLQPGVYRFYLGENVRAAMLAGEYTVAEMKMIRQTVEACAPQKAFPILAAEEREGIRAMVTRSAAQRTVDLKQRILENLPKEHFLTGDKGYKLKDVKDGRISLDAFIAQLSLEELETLSRGGYVMNNPLGPRGNAGVFGGTTESLQKKGIPPVVTTDGPSGIRLYDSATLLPIGTALACTFNLELVRELYAHVGREMKEMGSDVLLAPGMNIHRNPLCGRNFEYFSEDPLLTGKMAAAVVTGVQSQGLSACPKHFACNNQETNRNKTDSVVSQRALREIYLKGFEICVKEAKPKNLMTSYNKINGVWGHYHYELVQTILREDWRYQGNVLTDWWMQYAPSPEFPKVKSNGYRVRSRVNVLMPGSRNVFDKRKKPDGTLLATLKKKEGITLGELQHNAKAVLQCVMDLKER